FSATMKLPRNNAVIHNPVYDHRIIQLSQIPSTHPWLREAHTKIVVAIGRLVPEKGFDILLEALRLLRRDGIDVRCIVLGEGPEGPALKRRSKDLQIDTVVDFPGFSTNPYSFLARADVLAVPSRWEGFGNVIVEALTLNTPVVAARCPGGPVEI